MLEVASNDDGCFLFTRMSSCADLGSTQQSDHYGNSEVVAEKRDEKLKRICSVRQIFIRITPNERNVTNGQVKKALTIEQEPQRK